MIDLGSEVKDQCACEQSGSLCRIVCVPKAAIAIQICLVKFFMILAVQVVCNIRDFHPQVARELKDGHFWIYKIHAYNADHIGKPIVVIIAARVTSHHENIHYRWCTAHTHYGQGTCRCRGRRNKGCRFGRGSDRGSFRRIWSPCGGQSHWSRG